MSIDLRPTLTAPDEDPYLWLEDIDGDRACTWADAESAKTRAAYQTAQFQADHDALTTLLDRPDKLAFIARRGGHIYNYWTDQANPRGLWRRTSLDSYRSATPAWDVVLDLDALALAEGEDWVWQGAGTLPGTHDLAILRLSRGGSDSTVLREFDLTTRQFVAGGFQVPDAKGGAVWWDRDTVLLASVFGGEQHVTASGYARTVRLWRRGTDLGLAPVIFETERQHMSAWALVDRTTPIPRIWFTEKPGFFDSVYWIGDLTGPKTRIALPADVWFETHRDWMVVKPRTPWTVGGRTYAPDTLLGCVLSEFLVGELRFTELFLPSDRRALQSWFWTEGRLVLSILDELQPRFEVYTPTDAGWAKSDLVGIPAVGVVSLGRLDVEEAESNGDLMMTAEDPLTPTTLALVTPGNAPVVLKQTSRAFNPAGLRVTQHQAIGRDGERIPYTQVGPAETTGDAPVHMTGYGGFRVTSRPYYSTAVGKLWLERGGTHVIASIRGGGEFGTRWHEAGRREKKPVSHDDFAAVAGDLVRRGVTTPKRIAAEGGSNGGILISNMLTRYPEMFGALFCTIPLIDMRRYAKLLAGASWVAEYGDPDVPADWAFLQTYSAYHNLKAGVAYPPILVATTRKDDRVHPGHARKFAAKLQAIGHSQTRYFELAAGGHGYGKDNRERALFITLGFTFLADAIGWSMTDTESH
jgi:prolyl oligopeptidase